MTMSDKPTLDELEAILNDEAEVSIEILPNGEVRESTASFDAVTNPDGPREWNRQHDELQDKLHLLQIDRNRLHSRLTRLVDALGASTFDQAWAVAVVAKATPDEQALACLVNDAPDSALSVFDDGANIAIVLRHAPESVRMAVVRFARGLLTDPESLQIPPADEPVPGPVVDLMEEAAELFENRAHRDSEGDPAADEMSTRLRCAAHPGRAAQLLRDLAAEKEE